MPTLNAYLYFQGNCEQAFDFYKTIFGGAYEFLGRYKDVPGEARQNFPFCTDEQIMHITLPISRETTLMGADLITSNEDVQQSGNGFSLYIQADTKTEADRIFHALSDEGDVIVPLDDQFWGSYYGQCIDKFGISWKVSCIKKSL